MTTYLPSRPAPASEQDGGYSRITLIGRHKRADLVLPSSEPIGALLPGVLAILGERTAGDPRRLGIATAVGNLLPPDATLAGAAVPDGAVLRLVAEDEIPPPPVVNDVTEETAADLERHRGRWGAAARGASTIALAGALAALAATEVVLRYSAHNAFVGLVVAAATCWAVALVLAIVRLRWPAVAIACAGGATAVVGAAAAAPGEGWTVVDRWGAVIVAVWVAVGVGGVGWRARGPLLGALFGLVLGLAWVGLRRSALTGAEADALVAVAAVVTLGVLPRWAVTTSGLTALDDRRMTGQVVSRQALESSLVTAHATLIWSAVAASASLALTGTALALAGHQWPCWLAGAVALVSLLRARSFPLVAEVVAVLAATLAVVVGLEIDWSRAQRGSVWPLVTTGIGAAVLAASLLFDPPAHVRAQLRRIGDRVESLGVLALAPLLVGVFGVFGRLLNSF